MPLSELEIILRKDPNNPFLSQLLLAMEHTSKEVKVKPPRRNKR